MAPNSGERAAISGKREAWPLDGRVAAQLLTFDRRKRMLELVNERTSVSVTELQQLFAVSRMTISRDLFELERQGHLKRVRGGAISLSNIVVAPRASQSIKRISKEQQRIGKLAATRLFDGEFVIIESGSTCFPLVDNLVARNDLKIVTASPAIAGRLAGIVEQHDKDFQIILPGGTLNVSKSFLVGPATVSFFENIRVDMAFVSVTAIEASAGVTADDLAEAAVTSLILKKCSKRNIGLIVSSKFNSTSFYKVADISVFDEIITDDGLDRKTRLLFEKMGVKITTC